MRFADWLEVNEISINSSKLTIHGPVGTASRVLQCEQWKVAGADAA